MKQKKSKIIKKSSKRRTYYNKFYQYKNLDIIRMYDFLYKSIFIIIFKIISKVLKNIKQLINIFWLVTILMISQISLINASIIYILILEL